MEPITREEKLMAGQELVPITRKELFLAKAAGMDVQTPEPITREEMFLSQIAGGGSAPVVEPLTVTENGTYTAPEGVDGYNPVTVNVASAGGGSCLEGAFIGADDGSLYIDAGGKKQVCVYLKGADDYGVRELGDVPENTVLNAMFSTITHRGVVIVRNTTAYSGSNKQTDITSGKFVAMATNWGYQTDDGLFLLNATYPYKFRAGKEYGWIAF